MAISGYETEESFIKYICVTKKQFAIRMADYSFFNQRD